jgi:hypothetical protein
MLWVRTPLRWGVLDTTLCDKICQWLVTGQRFFLGTPVSSNNKTDSHDIAEILLKVALNTINPNLVVSNRRSNRTIGRWPWPYDPCSLSSNTTFYCPCWCMYIKVRVVVWFGSLDISLSIGLEKKQQQGLGLWCLMPLSTIFQLYRG